MKLKTVLDRRYNKYKYTFVCYRGYKKWFIGTDYLIKAMFMLLRLKKAFSQIDIEYRKYNGWF